MVNQGKIDRSFADAGWELDGGFTGHLVIGHDGDLSILANLRLWDDTHELYDVERHLTYRLREVSTLQRAAELIREYGEPSGEE